MTALNPNRLNFYEEPLLEFGHRQTMSNPKDGLYMFGPLVGDSKPKHIKVGVVGTTIGLSLYQDWARHINGFIPSDSPDSPNHTPFPGFNAVFDATLSPRPVIEAPVSATKLAQAIRISKRHEAVHAAVSLYEEAIRKGLEEDPNVDVWFVMVPEEIYKYGRPQSIIPRSEALPSTLKMSQRVASRLIRSEPSLFAEENEAARLFLFEPNFHHQLKARLLDARSVVLQIVRETTISALLGQTDSSTRRTQDPATIAWNIATTTFYKAGGHPWKLAHVRPRVCYIGLVFKKLDDAPGAQRNACCGAQMFLNSGEGLVFKGTPGRWYIPETRQFHLSRDEAKSLISRVVDAYKERDPEGKPPSELFIHGRTRFNEDEWAGFTDAITSETQISAIRITPTDDFKLFSSGDLAVLRGLAWHNSKTHGYLWTKGYVPWLKTYPGREVPNPLSVEIVRGDADLRTVMSDVLSLTKLNFNACIFADGYPVTLRFADAVGEIITAAPLADSTGTRRDPPLPFKHYI